MVSRAWIEKRAATSWWLPLRLGGKTDRVDLEGVRKTSVTLSSTVWILLCRSAAPAWSTMPR